MSEIKYKTGWIKDPEGNKFAPITTTDQVITSDGADLASEINNIKNDVTTLNSKLTDESEVTFTPNSDIMNGGNVNGDRFGNMCEITFGYQIKSGTYSSDTILGTCNVHPDHTVRFTVHTTNGSVSLYINKNGQVKFNSSSITFDSITYLLGQVFFVISE